MLSTTITLASLIAALSMMSPPIPTLLAEPATFADAPTLVEALQQRVAASTSAVVVVGASADDHAQGPPTAHQPTTQPEVIPVAVILMVAVPKGGDDTELKAEFKRQFPSFAEEHGLLDVGATGDEAELTFRLQIRQMGEDNYTIYSAAIYHDKMDTEVERTCLNCSPADVVADALTNLARAAAAVGESRAEIEAAKAESSVADVEPAISPPSPPRVRVFGAVSYVGFSSTVLGIGAAISGAVLLHRGFVIESEPGATTIDSVDYRPPGIALTGIGLGLMVVGNALVGMDVGVLLPRRRARAQVRLDSVSVTAAGSPGLTLRGRF